MIMIFSVVWFLLIAFGRKLMLRIAQKIAINWARLRLCQRAVDVANVELLFGNFSRGNFFNVGHETVQIKIKVKISVR